MHYIQGTHRYEIHYAASTSSDLIRYTDFDWAGDLNDHKSTSGYSFHLSSSPIFWWSKKQHAIVISSIEAEYLGVINATIKAI